jgi:hypothetical protein
MWNSFSCKHVAQAAAGYMSQLSASSNKQDWYA